MECPCGLMAYKQDIIGPLLKVLLAVLHQFLPMECNYRFSN